MCRPAADLHAEHGDEALVILSALPAVAQHLVGRLDALEVLGRALAGAPVGVQAQRQALVSAPYLALRGLRAPGRAGQPGRDDWGPQIPGPAAPAGGPGEASGLTDTGTPNEL
jgi:hypothetical protein